MKIATSLFSAVIELQENTVTSLIIEHPAVLYQFVENMYNQINGEEGNIIISEDNTLMKISKKVDLITSFIPFEINEKRLLSKIAAVLENEAVNETNYLSTMDLLRRIEVYIIELSEMLPCGISLSTVNVSSLIKMCGIKIEDTGNNKVETILQYMLLVRELLDDKLFILVNFRQFFSTTDVQAFIDTVIAHKLSVLLIEGKEFETLDCERKIIIDKDLCVV